MYLKVLDLTNFRSYEHQTLYLKPGITVFVGANGQGKTNLVEALWYLTTLRSHRVAQDIALIRRGATTAYVRALFIRAGKDLKIEASIAQHKSNEIRLQGKALQRPREVLGQVRAVLFSPEDLALVKGDPESRRRFLDEILFEIAPRYSAVKAEFEKVLKQRNYLLKQLRAQQRSAARKKRQNGAQIEPEFETIAGMSQVEAAAASLMVWDEQLARSGAELTRARIHLVNRLRPHIAYSYLRVATDEGSDPQLYVGLNSRENIKSPARINYASTVLKALAEKHNVFNNDELPATSVLYHELLKQLQSNHEEEIERGVTLAGPHRDDLEIMIHDFPAKGYASHGESWSLALALRLGAYDLLTIEEGDLGDGEPILILDDVFSELDIHRRERLGRIIIGASQVLITTANDSDIPYSISSLTEKMQLIDVTKGKAEPREASGKW